MKNKKKKEKGEITSIRIVHPKEGVIATIYPRKDETISRDVPLSHLKEN